MRTNVFAVGLGKRIRNRGARVAGGQLLIFCDDDILVEGRETTGATVLIP